MSRRFLGVLIGVTVFACAVGTWAAPPASAPMSASGSMRTQVRVAGAQADAVRSQNAALQVQVARMERQSAARAEQLRERDAEISALQKQLRAAGAAAPAPARASSGG